MRSKCAETPPPYARWREDCWTKTTLGHVYFVRHGEGWGCPIKIGWAKDPGQRVGELQVGTPTDLFLIGSFPGNTKLEREVHARFADLRIRGEWFRPNADLIALAIGRMVLADECYLRSGLPVPTD